MLGYGNRVGLGGKDIFLRVAVEVNITTPPAFASQTTNVKAGINSMATQNTELPVISIRNRVLFPGGLLRLSIGRAKVVRTMFVNSSVTHPNAGLNMLHSSTVCSLG